MATAQVLFRAVDLHVAEAQAQQHIKDVGIGACTSRCTLPVAGLDDPAMVAGIGSIDGVSYMMIGQQKGRNTKVPSVTDISGIECLPPMQMQLAYVAPGCWHMLVHAR